MRYFLYLLLIPLFFAAGNAWTEDNVPRSNSSTPAGISEKENVPDQKSYETMIKAYNDSNAQNHEFYKSTLQAYKDFDEKIVGYISSTIKVVSVILAVLIFVFVYLFRKTLSELKQDLTRDADRIKEFYSHTFKLLNEQAATNLTIFRSREADLKNTINEAKELNQKIREAIKKISDRPEIREPVAAELGAEEVIQEENTKKEIQTEVRGYEEDLKSVSEDEIKE